MAAKRVEPQINSEVASHLAESMDKVPMPAPTAVAMTLGSTQGPAWPDGSGKTKHPKDRGPNHGRVGQQAAVTAVHRTSRPQMPHSS
ncbi:hypothetical protein [Arthrobacter bambusae]|uniref:hypothetical protein n=1 Tax=Arthrobacter bambusae TaxID=1338426 RepID=UPI00277F7EE4|nr:hypothetical protein [Arthrobacter bambusae]MDQ0030690.1 hypothetical protein [Arthrobacter bambusae]MDQ0099023.1 hypothetical protein [Arthrobacter bambusae]